MKLDYLFDCPRLGKSLRPVDIGRVNEIYPGLINRSASILSIKNRSSDKVVCHYRVL